jgi:hypothetical protein
LLIANSCIFTLSTSYGYSVRSKIVYLFLFLIYFVFQLIVAFKVFVNFNYGAPLYTRQFHNKFVLIELIKIVLIIIIIVSTAVVKHEFNDKQDKQNHTHFKIYNKKMSF